MSEAMLWLLGAGVLLLIAVLIPVLWMCCVSDMNDLGIK